jgi:hypothetical protein
MSLESSEPGAHVREASMIVVTDTSTRTEIEAAIAAKRIESDRLPIHWTDARDKIAEELEILVDAWLKARA